MNMIYSAGDLAFLTACLDDIQTRMQELLRSHRSRGDREETLKSLTRIQQARQALAARKDGEIVMTLNDLRVFYIVVFSKRDELNRLLDVPGRPAGLQDDLLACVASCNSILRVIRSNVAEEGLDPDAFAASCTGVSLAALPESPDGPLPC